MRDLLRFAGVACTVIALCASAFAGECNQLDERGGEAGTTQPSFSKNRETAPLLYALPVLPPDVEVLEIRIVQGKHELVRETVAVPMGGPSNATIDVLYSHPHELRKYREIETATPGVLDFIVTSSGRVLTHEPFAAIDRKSAALTLDDAVGEIREITVSARPRPHLQAHGVTKDPYCQEQCDQDLASCLDWCDPRGDSCNICYTWYNDCLMMCPNVCTDPKSVTTYTTQTAVGYTYYGSSCRTEFGSTTLWDNVSIRYRVDKWERTENCDGSYSDRWISSSDRYDSCWTNSRYSCSYSVGAPPYPRC